VNFLTLKPLTADLLPAAVGLDQLCLGGLWTEDGYHRELNSPNSDLWILQSSSSDSKFKIQNSNSCTEAINRVSTQHPTPNPQLSPPLLALGCLWAILEEAHITLLAVHPHYQRQGLGQALLYALMVSAWQRRLEWITLEVRASNQTAIALYRKFGFQDVGTRRKYYQDTGEDALILWRSGLQKPDFQETLKRWCENVSDRLSQHGWHLEENQKL
jgi:[ribosomal protein S18]-alanine N-acetyltransferase